MKNSKLAFYNKLKNLDEYLQLIYCIRYQTAPVLMGYKPAITYTIYKLAQKYYWKYYGEAYLENEKCKQVILKENEEHLTILIYKEETLYKVLKEKDNEVYLKEIGYDTSSVSHMLGELIRRYRKGEVPHEIGLFLGIDLDNIKSYIAYSGMDYIVGGYWKVYSHIEESKQCFIQYDEAKEAMLTTILEELE